MPNHENSLLDAPQPGLRDNIDLGGQAGLATYVAAKIFNSAPLPPGMPDWLKDSIDSQANFAQRLPGMAEMTIGGASGGPLDVKTKEEREHEADEEATEYLTARLEQVDRQRVIEQQQWAQQVHSFASIQMTGTEWHDLGTELKEEGELREWLVSRFMKDGKSRKDAERKADDVANIADIMAKPTAERTDDERKKLEHAEKDPEIRKALSELNEHQLNGSGAMVHRDIAQADQTDSVTNRASLFASAPDLSEHHGVALAAKAPLDTQQIASAKPFSQPAAMPPASAGLEI